MNYEDEKWIKVYTRDTAAWLALPWQARGLMLEIARKLPPLTGELSLGRKGLPAIAALLRAPWDEIGGFIEELISEGSLYYDAERQVVGDAQHVERQTAVASGAVRTSNWRDRKRGPDEPPPSSKMPPPKSEARVTLGDAAVTGRDVAVTPSDAARPLDQTRSDQTRESESARPTDDSGLVTPDLPLEDDARARYATIAQNRPLATAVGDTWLMFCGHYAGQRFGSRAGLLGKFQKWLVDQGKIDDRERQREREHRDKAGRPRPVSETPPAPYHRTSKRKPSEPIDIAAVMQAAKERAGKPLFALPQNDEKPKTGTE